MCVKCVLRNVREKHPRKKLEEVQAEAKTLFGDGIPPEVETKIQEIRALLPNNPSPEFWDAYWQGVAVGSSAKKKDITVLFFAIQRREKECLEKAEVNDFDHCEVNIHD